MTTRQPFRVTLHGATYDADVLATPARYLGHLATLDASVDRPRSGLDLVFADDCAWVLEAWRDDAHHDTGAWTGDGSVVCTCGLVVPAGIDLPEARGHRRLRDFSEITHGFVVRSPRTGACGAICTACLAHEADLGLDGAHSWVAAHRC